MRFWSRVPASSLHSSIVLACGVIAMAACGDGVTLDEQAPSAGGAGGSGGSAPTSHCGQLYYSGPCDAPGLTCPWADVTCQQTFVCSDGEWRPASGLDCGAPPRMPSCDGATPLGAAWHRIFAGAQVQAVARDLWNLIVASWVPQTASVDGTPLAAEPSLVISRHNGVTGALTEHVAFAGGAVPYDLLKTNAGWSLGGQLVAPLAVGSSPLEPSGAGGPFVMQLDAALGPTWSTAFGGPSEETGARVRPLSDGSMVVVAELGGGAAIDGLVFGNAGATDVALARLGPGGSAVWAQSHGSIFQDTPHAISGGFTAGDVVVAGVAGQAIDLGGGHLPADQSAFVARYDADGNHVWSKTCSKDSAFTDIAGSPLGYIFLAGVFDGTFDCGGGSVSGHAGQHFVMALDGDGAVVWTRLLGEESVPDGALPRVGYAVGEGLVAATVDGGGVFATVNAHWIDEQFGTLLGERSFNAFGEVTLTGVSFASQRMVIAGHVSGAFCLGDGVGENGDPVGFLVAFPPPR